MKKTISVLLAVLMLFSVFAVSFSVFADEQPACPAGCKNPHVEEFGKCECCVDCPNVDMAKVAPCAKSNGQVKPHSQFCCSECTGLYTCRCGITNPNCETHCPFCQGKSSQDDPVLEPPVPPQTQANLREMFQQIMRRIAEVFDRMFEVVFAIFNIQD